MSFSLSAFLFTLVCCLISLIIAGKSGREEDKEWFTNLNHPDNSFLLKVMPIIGLIFYLLFGFVLYHLSVSKDIFSIVLTVVIIQLMGLSPLLKYKIKNLKIFFFVLLIFPVLTALLIFALLRTNSTLAIPVILFFFWLLYDLSYYYRLIKLNR